MVISWRSTAASPIATCISTCRSAASGFTRNGPVSTATSSRSTRTSPFRSDGDFLAEYCSQPHRDLHLNLPLCRERVHEERAGIHGNVEPFHPDLALLADRDSGHNGAN